jgi:DNA-binding MarR family transcriptional regulator
MMSDMVDYSNDPAVQVFADTETAMARMCRTAEAAGCRVVSALRFSDGLDVVSMALPATLILVELEDDRRGGAAIPLLDWLQREAECHSRRGVVSAPVGLIDVVAGSVNHAGIAHLCGADEAERIDAVVRASAPLAARVRDGGIASGARVLQRSPAYAPDSAGPADLDFIRAMLRARRLRDEHFPGDLFADPAWDILLDLMAARLERKQVTVSSLCLAAAVPPTTALRWIGVLAERGLLVRVADSADRRRAFVELSDAGARALGGWLRQARRLAAEAL